MKLSKKGTSLLILLQLLVVSAVVVLVGVSVLNINSDKRSKAASVDNVDMYFLPNDVNITSNTPLHLYLNVDNANGIGFVDAKFSFDQTKLQLAEEIVPTSRLATAIDVTSMSEANSTGQVRIMLGMSVSQVRAGQVVNGAFELAGLKFNRISSRANDPTSLIIGDSDVRNRDPEKRLTVNATNLQLNLNPGAATTIVPSNTRAPINTQPPVNTQAPVVPTSIVVIPTNPPAPTSTRAPIATVVVPTKIIVNPVATKAPWPKVTPITKYPLPADIQKADLNRDGCVNMKDIMFFMKYRKSINIFLFDVNNDGRVDLNDMRTIFMNYRKGC